MLWLGIVGETTNLSYLRMDISENSMLSKELEDNS